MRTALKITLMALLLGAGTWLVTQMHAAHAPTAASENGGREAAPIPNGQQRAGDGTPAPILVAGVQEPEEMQVAPFPAHVPSAAERAWFDMEKSQTENTNRVSRMTALNRLIERYPQYAVGYVLRLGELCKGTDRAALLADVTRAMRYWGSVPPEVGSSKSLLSIRAKARYDMDDVAGAVDDLEELMKADPEEAIDFASSNAVAPEQTAKGLCMWTQPDMDALVQKRPSDYRTHLFRGLYYGYFTTFNEQYLDRALQNLRRAHDLNGHSALPNFYAAAFMRGRGAFYYAKLMTNVPEVRRHALLHAVLAQLNAALDVNPQFQPALHARAGTYADLKQFAAEIADYDSILLLNAQDAIAYNDRGLAQAQLGNSYEAIADFGKAIEHKTRELQKSSSYENRAAAYIATRQWDLAIRDLTTALSLQVGGAVLLMSIDQFRALYPEYASASDEAVVRKLQQTFYPDMTYENFSANLLRENVARGFWASTILPELYMKRSDAYLSAGHWRMAVLDFRRAVNGFPDYADAIDRWRDIGVQERAHLYLDVGTFDDARSDSIKLWVKRVHDSADVSSPYELQEYELNCGTRQIRAISLADYGASGTLLRIRQGGDWGSVVPESAGELLLSGACTAKRTHARSSI